MNNTSTKVKFVLINPYELGRQPLALAEPAALLRAQGHEVSCIDLSRQCISEEALRGASIVAIYLGMHTATRIAVEALPRIVDIVPESHLCAFGLYAPMNDQMLKGLGVHTILDGDPETAFLELAESIQKNGEASLAANGTKDQISFVTPDRTGLPALSEYASLSLPDGSSKVVGFTDSTRGCKHLCRHCPVVPVYEGSFRAIPRDVVLSDIRQQIEAGAQHISFGDHDFFNGPTHAMRIVRQLNREFPDITYDAVIKIQHLLEHQDLLVELKSTGCLFVTTAVESLDDRVLEYLDKNHTRDDFRKTVTLLRQLDIGFAPTFIPFTPWTTLADYLELLQELVELQLVESVPPIQLSIRLLIPNGSWLFKLEEFENLVGAFDSDSLGYPWKNSDAGVDRLHQRIHAWIEKASSEEMERKDIFAGIWEIAHEANQLVTPPLPEFLGKPVAAMSEPWYCCAEPTQQQLQAF